MGSAYGNSERFQRPAPFDTTTEIAPTGHSRGVTTLSPAAVAARARAGAVRDGGRSVRQARGGLDSASFAALYEAHFRAVWRMLRRLGVHDAHLDDAVQDVFVAAWRRAGDFEGRSAVRTWLLGIAVRVASEYRRRRQKTTEEIPEHLEAERADPHASSEQAEAVRRLHTILGKMDEAKREVFVLTELEQYTAPEIAEALELNVNTVYTRLRAARLEFNSLLELEGTVPARERGFR